MDILKFKRDQYDASNNNIPLYLVKISKCKQLLKYDQIRG